MSVDDREAVDAEIESRRVEPLTARSRILGVRDEHLRQIFERPVLELGLLGTERPDRHGSPLRPQALRSPRSPVYTARSADEKQQKITSRIAVSSWTEDRTVARAMLAAASIGYP